MRDTFRIIFQMKAAIQGNTLLYYLKRVPLIKELFSDSMYADSKLKETVSLLAVLLVQVSKLMSKGLYLLVAVVLPVVGVMKGMKLSDSRALPLMVHILFCLSCVSGPLQSSSIFSVTRQKFICVKYMKMDAGRYVRCDFFMEYALFFLYFLPFIFLLVLLAGGSAVQALLLWLTLIAFRMMGEAFQLWLFDKKGVVFSRKQVLMWLLVALMLSAAYAPLFLGAAVPTMRLLLSLPGVLAVLLLGGLSLYYCMWGYGRYGEKLPRVLDAKYIVSVQTAKSGQLAFRDVQMKDSDLKADRPRAEKFRSLHGYAYLNAMFFERHRRLLLKPVFIRLIAIGALFAAGLVGILFSKEMAAMLGEKLSQSLPLFVFIMYFLSVAEKACRAMFYNCDISLLRYGFYRNPKVILHNFRIRLLRIMGYNLLIGFALSAAVLGFMAACGLPWLTLEMLSFTGAVLLLSVFFTVHHLFLYYVLQPYTTELNVKNPLFNIINSVVYFFCFFCMRVKTASSTFTVGVLLLTGLYIAVALTLVYKYAPKTFRVK